MDSFIIILVYFHVLVRFSGADWRSGKRRGLRTKGSLVRDLVAAEFVVASSKSHFSLFSTG